MEKLIDRIAAHFLTIAAVVVFSMWLRVIVAEPVEVSQLNEPLIETEKR